MPGRVAEHREVAPRVRVRADGPDGDGCFYPREAVEILGLSELDYRQLRRLYKLVRKQAGYKEVKGRLWARFSLLDLAAMRVAVELAAPDAGAERRGQRLQLAPVEGACEALRSAGVENPLLDVRMERVGRKVFAVVEGHMVDPTSGQGVLDWSQQAARNFLVARELEVASLDVALRRSPSKEDPRVRSRVQVV